MPTVPYPAQVPDEQIVLHPIGNPTALVQWAVFTGRISAADSAAWLGYLSGPGAVDYANQLIGEMSVPFVEKST